MTNCSLLRILCTAFAMHTAFATLPTTTEINRLGSVDLGILAETTPIVWKNQLWLMECIQGKKYYGNMDGESYIRFTNPFTGERSPHLAVGYGLGNALVQNQTIYVFATKPLTEFPRIIQRSAFSGRMILCRLHGSQQWLLMPTTTESFQMTVLGGNHCGIPAFNME